MRNVPFLVVFNFWKCDCFHQPPLPPCSPGTLPSSKPFLFKLLTKSIQTLLPWAYKLYCVVLRKYIAQNNFANYSVFFPQRQCGIYIIIFIANDGLISSLVSCNKEQLGSLHRYDYRLFFLLRVHVLVIISAWFLAAKGHIGCFGHIMHCDGHRTLQLYWLY